LGALLIKEREGLTDRGTVEAIQENPYMQFFIGLQEFTDEPAFDASLMVDFRKRFGEAGLARINEAVALLQLGIELNEPAATEQTPNEQDSNEQQAQVEARSAANAANVNDTANDNLLRDSSTNNTPACDDSSGSRSTTAESNIKATQESSDISSDNDADNPNQGNPNRGQLIMDATCAPADIHRPAPSDCHVARSKSFNRPRADLTSKPEDSSLEDASF
jgi:Transposase domain (DUF772)